MWHTSRGDRTLLGAEAALVSAAIDSMIDELMIHLEDDFDDDQFLASQYGITVYDSLTLSQRVGLLHEVARYLLTETDTVLPLSAATEATVAAIFIEIRDQVGIEIDFSQNADADAREQLQAWRSLVLAAACASDRDALEMFDQEDDLLIDLEPMDFDLPEVASEDKERWFDLIETLANHILWDRDFELADSFLDEDPGLSQQRRRILGIDDDYFTCVAPDPLPDELESLVMRTRDITRSKPR